MLSLARTGRKLVKHFMNLRCHGGATPLILAARAGRTAAVSYLLSMGAPRGCPQMSTEGDVRVGGAARPSST